MNSAREHYSTETVDEAQSILSQFADNAEQVTAAVLLSSDGFEIASLKVTADTASRLAAMGSSLAAVGAGIAKEAGLNNCTRLMVESDLGMMSVSYVRSDPELVLIVVVDDPTALGKLMWASKRCTKSLETLFS